MIITQKVDRTDPILGFFHRWLLEFALHCEQTNVIGQMKGDYDLPDNVRIHSMGKESGAGKLSQILRFWKLQWSLRRDYDCVLVHMTPIWVVLGFFNWFILRKKVYLWYEARGGGWALPISLRLVKKVFSATEYGLPRPSKKRVITGHGIDTEFFKPTGQIEKGLVSSVGRITKRKHFEVVLKAFSELPSDYKLEIAGVTIRKDDEVELRNLKKLMSELGITDRVAIKQMTHEEVRDLLQKSELMLHACRGGLDKIVLEAMSVGCLTVSSSKAAGHVLPTECLSMDDEMGERANELLKLSDDEKAKLRQELRQKVIDSHGLNKLIGRLVEEMK